MIVNISTVAQRRGCLCRSALIHMPFCLTQCNNKIFCYVPRSLSYKTQWFFVARLPSIDGNINFERGLCYEKIVRDNASIGNTARLQ